MRPEGIRHTNCQRINVTGANRDGRNRESISAIHEHEEVVSSCRDCAENKAAVMLETTVGNSFVLPRVNMLSDKPHNAGFRLAVCGVCHHADDRSCAGRQHRIGYRRQRTKGARANGLCACARRKHRGRGGQGDRSGNGAAQGDHSANGNVKRPNASVTSATSSDGRRSTIRASPPVTW